MSNLFPAATIGDPNGGVLFASYDTSDTPPDPGTGATLEQILQGVATLLTMLYANVAALTAKVDALPNSQSLQDAIVAALAEYGAVTGTQGTANTNAILGAIEEIESGGGGGTGLTPEQIANWDAAMARINAVPGGPDAPVVTLPDFVAPVGMVRVLLRPTLLKVPVDRDFSVYYVNQDRPLLDDSIEMVKEGSPFIVDEEKFGDYKGLMMPVDDTVVYYAANSMAALSKNTARFKVTALVDEQDAHFLDELIEAYTP